MAYTGDDKEFDWIDDAFNDKKTAEDIERAKGPGAAGVLLVVALLAAAALIIFGFVAIAASVPTS